MAITILDCDTQPPSMVTLGKGRMPQLKQPVVVKDFRVPLTADQVDWVKSFKPTAAQYVLYVDPKRN